MTVRGNLKEFVSDPDEAAAAISFGCGLIGLIGGLALLPDPAKYSLIENVARGTISTTVLGSGAILIYYPVKDTIEGYSRIVHRRLQKLYYKLRKKQLQKNQE